MIQRQLGLYVLDSYLLLRPSHQLRSSSRGGGSYFVDTLYTNFKPCTSVSQHLTTHQLVTGIRGRVSLPQMGLEAVIRPSLDGDPDTSRLAQF